MKIIDIFAQERSLEKLINIKIGNLKKLKTFTDFEKLKTKLHTLQNERYKLNEEYIKEIEDNKLDYIEEDWYRLRVVTTKDSYWEDVKYLDVKEIEVAKREEKQIEDLKSKHNKDEQKD